MSLEQTIAELTAAVKENTAVQQAVLKTLSVAAGAAPQEASPVTAGTVAAAAPAAAPAKRGRPAKSAAAGAPEPTAVKAAETPPAATNPPATAPAAGAKSLTVKELTDKCIEALNKAGRAATVAILDHYKVSRASEIKPELWQEAYDRFQAAIAGGGAKAATPAPAAVPAAPAKAEGDLV